MAEKKNIKSITNKTLEVLTAKKAVLTSDVASPLPRYQFCPTNSRL